MGPAADRLRCLAASLTDVAADAAPSADFAVTDDGASTRHDVADQAIRHRGNPATSPAEDDVPDDGGNRRQGNEPTVAIDPTDPDVIVARWNDYCQTDLRPAGWRQQDLLRPLDRPAGASPGATSCRTAPCRAVTSR